ncbi:hypothetical protein CCMSSC00406_0005457 [Pleurotus cornucopiae]|uniref:Uncharacterized protein n=1 Tax=Pleurotus cornucopiae TaxID=5321 RepID=A0ACB7ITQ9_PLECO|nr:hypothetical protein CCMSSC00406_0005457 [Pleurotus cornucopiae]
MPPSHLRLSTLTTLTTRGREPCPSYHSHMMEGVIIEDRQSVDLDAPPNYRPPSTLPPSFTEVRSPPPIGEASRQGSVHQFPQESSAGEKSLVLTLWSSASSKKHTPLFFEGDDIEGSVSLKLAKAEYVQAIKIAVRGKLISGSTASAPPMLTFLDFSHTVWDRDMPHPQSLTPTHPQFDGKLSPGEYTWPFSFIFPSGVTLAGCHASHLPHTFLERDLNGNVQYELVLRLVRGKFKPDKKIRTMVAHIPRIVAMPPLPLRQRAYLQNTVLFGPDDDAEGWLTLSPTMVYGKVFNNRPAEVKCVLSISQPLSYARGTVIPCYLKIMSLDSQTLDLLTSSSIDVRLRRSVNFYFGVSKGNKKLTPTQTQTDDIEAAVWRPLPPMRASSSVQSMRQFEGEIHLPKDLQPTSDFSLLTIEYSVVLLPFAVTGFSARNSEPSLAQPVDIVTECAPGPRHIQYLPRAARSSRLKSPAQRGTSDEVDLMTNIGSFNGLLMG